MSASDKPQKSIANGEKYYVQWRNGNESWHVAVIVERRPIKRPKASSGETSSSSSVSKSELQSLPPSELEYYVHYLNFDRRLDEWVSYERIDLATPVDESLAVDKDSHGHHGSAHSRMKKKRKSGDLSESKREEKEAMLANLEKEHEEITKVKNIQSIELGKYEIETWYFSPYPDEYCGEEKLFLCEFCLKYMKKKKTLERHAAKCDMTYPPGIEIYREEGLSMFEVDGKENKIYCQNLCLLSKLFLDHKTLYYDVDPFLFYVLCEVDEQGYHIVGYFSKEKHSQENYNLACILTFPPYQRKGYGKFLISISYELTKRENTTGSPEKPLSDLGKISYRSYWAFIILTLLETKDIRNITLQDIAKQTGIKIEDILSTLHALNLIKYWKGQHIISISQKVIDNHLKQAKKIRLCDPRCLSWQPPEKTSKKSSF